MTDYVYLGDRLTDPALRGMRCSAVRRPDGKCIRAKNGSMLVIDEAGNRVVVIGRLLRKIKDEAMNTTNTTPADAVPARGREDGIDGLSSAITALKRMYDEAEAEIAALKAAGREMLAHVDSRGMMLDIAQDERDYVALAGAKMAAWHALFADDGDGA